MRAQQTPVSPAAAAMPGLHLRNSEHKLPDLVVGFKGTDYQPIRFELSGRFKAHNGAEYVASPKVRAACGSGRHGGRKQGHT